MAVSACPLQAIKVTTYPREGTETEMADRKAKFAREVTTYPREGTETMVGRGTRLFPGKSQLIPARGRKLEQSEHVKFIEESQLIPARGRKHQ